ncbi:GABA permease [Coccidioides immitis RMSCC 2394]|uniref:GABA permease n=1 Tax=Coccidioides immitis RMSCC 2394 TaxID=404692 RepID=A0A0J7ASQ7_COCIT|nr:GABA permease [Coccidioides immitis RMSCC 2394]
MPKLFNMVSPPGSSTDEPKSPYLHPSASSLEYSLNPAETTDGDDFVSPFQGHTRNDQRDMMRMGKNQEFARMYRPVAALSFSIVLGATWEFMLLSQHEGLNDGGVAGLFWSYVWTFIGFGFCVYSMAEMASMAPISGGQYHWVSEFASPKYQRFLSYITGWMSVLAWQAGAAAGPFLAGTLIQGLIILHRPSYEPARWQGTLLVCAMAFCIYVVNVWFARAMPMIQNILLVLHVLGFLIVIIVLWAMAPRNSPRTVFTAFTDRGGWSTIGLSLMVGQITAIYGSLSMRKVSPKASDATAHMAEEVRDASRHVPRAMAWGYIINCIMGIILLVTYLFALPSVGAAIENPTSFPFLYVFGGALAPSGVTILAGVVLLLVFSSNITYGAAASRQTFSFARDHGLPFSEWLAAVHNTKHIPTNSILFTCIFTSLLSLIYIGSEVAFNAIISLYAGSLMFTYAFSVGSVLYQRIYHPAQLPPASWSLGKRGGPIVNAISLLYIIFALFWCFWPNKSFVTVDNFNWGVVMFLAVACASLVMYFVQGRKVYEGPVSTVIGRY